ncbi:FeoA family protein [Sphaerochaeta globosa]|jgi:Fe2+ transport system protein FeoA|uniref:FeoA family protein n=1 Tax=Sphaerochaeta globosa (strain ATCC BAA-1886 / DSM 22777 / Buddy) TaxID=158189 RepID=F0RX14_SPHGB|nr:ferrous iron transport protein A [Sphaerochaeta globosa]ADY11864.1 FeoA family protein [Sphaerochaeta globosa str. Buddy]
MTLGDLRPKQKARVLKIGTQGQLRQRILDMGITPMVEVELIKVAPLGDPLEFLVRGYQLSLRKSDALLIEVEKV